MEGPYARFFQLTKANSSIFAPDLMELLEEVGRPVAEFKGIMIPGGAPDEIHWEVECTLRGAVVPPETDPIVFEVRTLLDRGSLPSHPGGDCPSSEE